MSERQQLLDAIRDAKMGNHSLRLAYADYLEEHGAGDLDAATVEFIRVSCSGVKESNVMPLVSYVWLAANWSRLIPSVVALHLPEPLSQAGFLSIYPGPAFEARGRDVWMRIRLPNPRPTVKRPSYLCSCTFTFWKGFAIRFHAWSDFTKACLKDAIRQDQPLCSFERVEKPVIVL